MAVERELEPEETKLHLVRTDDSNDGKKVVRLVTRLQKRERARLSAQSQAVADEWLFQELMADPTHWEDNFANIPTQVVIQVSHPFKAKLTPEQAAAQNAITRYRKEETPKLDADFFRRKFEGYPNLCEEDLMADFIGRLVSLSAGDTVIDWRVPRDTIAGDTTIYLASKTSTVVDRPDLILEQVAHRTFLLTRRLPSQGFVYPECSPVNKF